jgi:predicted  nucleic acid-binding Zn-ribbon protein
MTVWDIVSLILNLLLGGGLFVSLATLRSARKKANSEAEKAAAEARADEIKNVESAIKIWREMAETMTDNYRNVSEQVQKLTKEVTRLTNINNKIVKLLDKITPDNLTSTVAEIKEQIKDN